MHNDINTKRTELANQMAAAGAALLDFTGTACAMAAIPDTEPQQYVAAGTPENIAAILPATICPQRRQKHGERPTEPLQFDSPAATSGDAPARTSIVQDVRDLFSACGFEVREGAGFCELVGSIDAGGVLVEAVLTDFGARSIESAAVSAATKPTADAESAWRQYIAQRTQLMDTSSNRAVFAAGYSAAATKPTADLSKLMSTSIRDYPDFTEDVERLSQPGLAKKQAKIIRKAIYDTIDARVRNSIIAAQVACESADVQSLLATMLAAAPSPQIAEKVELPPHAGMLDFMDEFGKLSHKRGWTEEQVRDAIAASRRAAGGMSIEIKHAPAGKTDFARGEILGYEGSPTRFMVVGEDDLYLHTFILGTGMYWGVRKEEPNLACLVRYSAAQPAEGAGQAGQVAMTADELAALRRFYECAADGEGYDVPKPMMRRLSEIGVVQRISGAYYHTTEYGLAVLDSAERAAAQAEQPSAQKGGA